MIAGFFFFCTDRRKEGGKKSLCFEIKHLKVSFNTLISAERGEEEEEEGGRGGGGDLPYLYRSRTCFHRTQPHSCRALPRGAAGHVLSRKARWGGGDHQDGGVGKGLAWRCRRCRPAWDVNPGLKPSGICSPESEDRDHDVRPSGRASPKGVSPKDRGAQRGASPVAGRAGSGDARPRGQQGCALAQNDGGKGCFLDSSSRRRWFSMALCWRNRIAFVPSHFTSI